MESVIFETYFENTVELQQIKYQEVTEKMGCNIAIDGPAGAGKSTIAKKVAKELSFIYVDTGAMYRAVALYLLKNKIQGADTQAVADNCQKAQVSLRYENGEQVVILNGENVNQYIRTEEVGNMASRTCLLYTSDAADD